MSFRCDNCFKSSVVGVTQRHRRGVAGKRWNKRAQATVKVFRPNLQNATLLIDGKRERVKLCVKCLKKLKKEHALAHQNLASL